MNFSIGFVTIRSRWDGILGLNLTSYKKQAKNAAKKLQLILCDDVERLQYKNLIHITFKLPLSYARFQKNKVVMSLFFPFTWTNYRANRRYSTASDQSSRCFTGEGGGGGGNT